jgi:hypothetical protein
MTVSGKSGDFPHAPERFMEPSSTRLGPTRTSARFPLEAAAAVESFDHARLFQLTKSRETRCSEAGQEDAVRD